MFRKVSKIGKRHFEEDAENQDVICHGENNNFRVISLADGVSTCKQAKKGAEIASQEITRLFLEKGDYFFEYESGQSVDLILSHILYELEYKAKEGKDTLIDYSSTLSSVAFDKKKGRLLCFNLGDSIIIAVQDDKCRVLAMPSDSSFGCCVTTTENAKDMVTLKIVNADALQSIIICSDGAWNVVYDNGKLKLEVAKLFIRGDFDSLDEFMSEQNCQDDYSFISMNI